MAKPPRIPNLLPWQRETVYFITICVNHRQRVLAEPPIWQACLDAIARLNRWEVDAMVLMPDHIHFLAAPLDRDLGVEDFSKGFKYLVTRALQPAWEWQVGSFDRLLRKEESAVEKWQYMRENPVRAGLVEQCEDWRYQFWGPGGGPADGGSAG